MSDSSQRTEKPTPRRLEQARREGQFAVSKDFVAGHPVRGVRVICRRIWQGLAHRTSRAMAAGDRPRLPRRANRLGVSPLADRGLEGRISAHAGRRGGAHVVRPGGALRCDAPGFSTKKLMPDLSRLSPLKRLAELPKQNLVQLAQAAVMMPLFFWAVWVVAKGHVAAYMELPFLGIDSGLRVVADSIDSLLWKAAALLLAWGAIDWLRQHQRFAAGLAHEQAGDSRRDKRSGRQSADQGADPPPAARGFARGA